MSVLFLALIGKNKAYGAEMQFNIRNLLSFGVLLSKWFCSYVGKMSWHKDNSESSEEERTCKTTPSTNISTQTLMPSKAINAINSLKDDSS